MAKRLKTLLDAPNIKGLAANIALGSIATIGVSLPIAALGWLDAGSNDLDTLPAGLVVLIWTILIGGFGAARWLAGRAGSPSQDEQGGIVAVAAACLFYPFYTAGLSSPAIGLVANIVIAIACARITDRLMQTAKFAAALMALPIPWLVFASLLILREWVLVAR